MVLRTPSGRLVLVEIGIEAGRACLERVEVDGQTWGRGKARLASPPKGAQRIALVVWTKGGRGIGLDEANSRKLKGAMRRRTAAEKRRAGSEVPANEQS